MIYEAAIKRYGADRVAKTQLGGVMIHFPLLRVRNNRGQSKNIYDTFLRINLRYDESDKRFYPVHSTKPINITRTTFDMLEVNNKYIHSHAYLVDRQVFLRNIGAWAEFCLRGNNIEETHNSFRYGTYNKEELELKIITYLVSLERFLCSEDIEGVPTMPMASCLPFLPIASMYAKPTVRTDLRLTYSLQLDNDYRIKNNEVNKKLLLLLYPTFQCVKFKGVWGIPTAVTISEEDIESANTEAEVYSLAFNDKVFTGKVIAPEIDSSIDLTTLNWEIHELVYKQIVHIIRDWAFNLHRKTLVHEKFSAFPPSRDPISL